MGNKNSLVTCKDKISSNLAMKLKKTPYDKKLKVLIYTKSLPDEILNSYKIKVITNYVIIAELTPKEIQKLSCEKWVVYISHISKKELF